MMRNWFTCKIRYFKMGEDGKAKKVTEPYLIDALTYTEAEARIHQEVGAYVGNEFQITNIAKSPIAEVFHYDDSETWYKAKVSYVDIDHDSGREKKVSKNMLVTAHSVKQSCERIQESMKGMLVDFEIEAVAKTTIVEIFPYIPGEKAPEGFVPVAEAAGGVAQAMSQAAALSEAMADAVEEATSGPGSRYSAPEGEEEEEFDEEEEELIGDEPESEQEAEIVDEDDEVKSSEEAPADEDEDDDEDLEAIESQLGD